MRMIKTTIFGGILFLLPLVILVLVLGKALQLTLLLAKPIQTMVPVESVAGIALIDLLAVILLLAVCYLAGLAAKVALIRSKVSGLDEVLGNNVPLYAIIKTIISSIAKAEDEAGTLHPVIVRFDDYSQIAFEVERQDEQVVIYLPGAPSPWSGSTLLVEASRVSPLDMPATQAVKLLRALGRGSAKLAQPRGR